MNYVFFDVECANCLKGEGKICSLGYVKTDSDFNVMKKKDILINPDAPFLLGNAAQGKGIKLAYPLFRFKWADTFPSYYEEIKKLLENEDNMVFGFSVGQDVSYLSYTCSRYQLPQLDFPFYDIQLFEKKMRGEKNIRGLDSLIEEFQLDKYTLHRSDDDALMTLEVFKKLLEISNLTVEEGLEKYPCRDTSLELTARVTERRKQREKEKRIRNRMNRFYTKRDEPDLSYCNHFLTCIRVCVQYDCLKQNLEYFEQKKKVLEQKGVILTRSAADSDIFVVNKYTKNTLNELPFLEFKSLLEQKSPQKS